MSTHTPPDQQAPSHIQQPPFQNFPPSPKGPASLVRPIQSLMRRRLKLWQWALIGVGALIVLAIIGNALGSGSTSAPSGPSVASHPTSTSAAQPTSAPTSTAQPTSAPTSTHAATSGAINDAILGGPDTIFPAYYQPVNYIAQNTARSFTGTVNGQRVWIVASLDNLSHARVQGIVVHPLTSDVTWNATMAGEVAKTFMPSDAKYVGDYQPPDFGVEHVYQSAALAATFPASAFSNLDTGKLVPPGTFYVAYDNTDIPQGACFLGLGE